MKARYYQLLSGIIYVIGDKEFLNYKKDGVPKQYFFNIINMDSSISI